MTNTYVTLGKECVNVMAHGTRSLSKAILSPTVSSLLRRGPPCLPGPALTWTQTLQLLLKEVKRQPYFSHSIVQTCVVMKPSSQWKGAPSVDGTAAGGKPTARSWREQRLRVSPAISLPLVTWGSETSRRQGGRGKTGRGFLLMVAVVALLSPFFGLSRGPKLTLSLL